jgi:hypothetical protein
MCPVSLLVVRSRSTGQRRPDGNAYTVAGGNELAKGAPTGEGGSSPLGDGAGGLLPPTRSGLLPPTRSGLY